MSTTDAAGLRTRSRDAFGQDYQLEVMLRVADTDGDVNLTDIATALELKTSHIQSAWKRLVTIGLLQPTSRDRRTKNFTLRESAAWAWARELAGDLWEPDN